METKLFKDKNGREWICGKGTAEEVELLNIEKDFDTALDVLRFLIKQYGYFLNITLPMAVNRGIYGKRKAI